MSEHLLEDSPSRAGLWRSVAAWVRPHRVVLVCALLTALLTSVLTMGAAVLVGRAADAALADDGRTAVLLALAGVAAAVTCIAAEGLSTALLARAGEYVVRDLRDGIVERLLGAPLRFLERHRAGELLQRSTAEVAALSAFVRESLPELLTAATMLLVAMFMLSVESWQLLALLVISFVPPAWWMAARFRAAAPEAFGDEASAEAAVMADLSEIIRVRELLATADAEGRAHFTAKLEDLNHTAVSAQMRTARLGRWINAVTLVEGLSLVVLLVAGAWLVDVGAISVGVVVTFLVASRTLFSSFTDISALVSDFEEAATGAARLRQLLDLPSAPPSGSEPSSGSLELDGVHFGYDDEPVLKGLCLAVEPGQRVGIAGRSGAGKSTLAKVLSGLYEPSSGTVRAPRVMLVPQQVQLGSGSLADELRLARPDATDADLREAVGRLGLTSWLEGLSDGLETSLAGATMLSAGERQLVGLIRVALVDAAVLVLDEATSDLDPAIAALVEAAVDRLAGERSVVVIAHRPGTLDGADVVYRMRDGALEKT